MTAGRPTGTDPVRAGHGTGPEATQVHELVAALHAVVHLMERVRAQRLRLLGLLLVLNLADLATTARFLALGGTEGNAVLAPIVDRWWAVLGVKAVVLVCLGHRILGAPARSAEASWLVRLAVGYYTVVVLWNVVVIQRLSGPVPG